MRAGLLMLGGGLGTVVLVVGETPTKYRVRLPNDATGTVVLPDGRRLIGSVTHLVPKAIVRSVGLGAVLGNGDA